MRHRYGAVAGCAVAERVEHLPETFAGEAEPHLAGGHQLAAAFLGNENRFKPAHAQLTEAGDHEIPGAEHLGLEPVTRLAASVCAAKPLRDNALAADLTHGFEQLT